jgi:SAM-dependent methyltransferase
VVAGVRGMTTLEPEKLAAIECWSADPCGAIDGDPGTREYAERLVQARRDYAPWMDDALDYAGASGLDVLDVGCGQGIDLIRYARAHARIVGIDLTPRHVELARAHLASLDLAGTAVEGDAEALPFPDESFDRVSSNGVLHHTPDMARALREVWRVLRPGGETRIILYNRDSVHYWLRQVLLNGVVRGGLIRERSMAGILSARIEHSTIGARPLVCVYSARQVRAALAEAGFARPRTTVPLAWPTVSYPRAVEKLHAVRPLALRELTGRLAGWYIQGWFVVGIGVKS